MNLRLCRDQSLTHCPTAETPGLCVFWETFKVAHLSFPRLAASSPWKAHRHYPKCFLPGSRQGIPNHTWPRRAAGTFLAENQAEKLWSLLNLRSRPQGGPEALMPRARPDPLVPWAPGFLVSDLGDLPGIPPGRPRAQTQVPWVASAPRLLRNRDLGSSHCGAVETDLTSIHEDAGLIPDLARWVKDPALP